MLIGLQILNWIKALADVSPLIRKLPGDIHRFLIMILALFITWGGLNIIRERDVMKGLQIAFFDSNEAAANRVNTNHVAALQEELRRSVGSNQAVHRIMQAELEPSGAARVSLGIIHNGTYSVTGIGLMQVNTTQAIAAPGRSPGDLVQNEPLSHWDDFLEKLNEGKCSYVLVSSMQKSLAARARYADGNVASFAVCPVIDSRNQTLGALFIMWDKFDPAPTGDELTRRLGQHMRAATQIAGAMEILR